MVFNGLWYSRIKQGRMVYHEISVYRSGYFIMWLHHLCTSYTGVNIPSCDLCCLFYSKLFFSFSFSLQFLFSFFPFCQFPISFSPFFLFLLHLFFFPFSQFPFNFSFPTFLFVSSPFLVPLFPVPSFPVSLSLFPFYLFPISHPITCSPFIYYKSFSFDFFLGISFCLTVTVF